MQLRDAFGDVLDQAGCQRINECEIQGLELDSRNIKVGDVFVAIKGHQQDGHEYIDAALKSGASAIISEQALSIEKPNIVVADLKSKLSQIASNVYHLDRQFKHIFAVTGTNGKTTTSYLLAQLLDESCGLIGTLGAGTIGNLQSTKMTTPDAITVQRLLLSLSQASCDSVCMEVSSHALEQCRVAAVDFDIAAFSNLSQDHLDYHGSIEAYKQAKFKLFDVKTLRHAVINIDDNAGFELAEHLNQSRSDLQVFTVSRHNSSADLKLDDVQSSEKGYACTVHYQSKQYSVEIPLFGEFNLDNVLLAAGMALVSGLSIESLIEKITAIILPEGRMTHLVLTSGVSVIIDFAHTPDALERVLKSLLNHKKRDLICVFGCGGDRDQSKRPVMGEIVSRYANSMIITSDNPRSESPVEICEQIAAGIDSNSITQCTIEIDRAEAIKQAIELADSGDIILIAGKGHEDYQEINGKRLPFSDEVCVSQFAELRH